MACPSSTAAVAQKSIGVTVKPTRSWADIAKGQKQAADLKVPAETALKASEAEAVPSSVAVVDEAQQSDIVAAPATDILEVSAAPMDEPSTDKSVVDVVDTVATVSTAMDNPGRSFSDAKSAASSNKIIDTCGDDQDKWEQSSDDKADEGGFCGKVLSMFSKYGWISPISKIDHPEAYRNGGRIYFSYDDVLGQVNVGDFVSFNVYADGQGLGADHVKLGEWLHPEQYTYEQPQLLSKEWAQHYSGFRAEAPAFVPVGRGPPGLVPYMSAQEQQCWHTRNRLAAAMLRADVGSEIRWEVVLDAVATVKPAAVLCAPSKTHFASSSTKGSTQGSTHASDLSDHASNGSSSDDECDSADAKHLSGLECVYGRNALEMHRLKCGLLPPPGL